MAEGNITVIAKQDDSDTPWSETSACWTLIWYINLGDPVISTQRDRMFQAITKLEHLILQGVGW